MKFFGEIPSKVGRLHLFTVFFCSGSESKAVMVAFISTLHASSGVKDPSNEEVKNEMLKNEVFSKLVLLPEKEKKG